MEHTLSPAALRRFDTLTSADDFMEVPELGPQDNRENEDNVDGHASNTTLEQVEYVSVMDLNHALTSPKSATEQLSQRRISEPPNSGMLCDDSNLSFSSLVKHASQPLRRQPRSLSNRLYALGRRARDSIADIGWRKHGEFDDRFIIREEHDSASQSVVAQATSSTADMNEAEDSMASTYSPSPVGSLHMSDLGSVMFSYDEDPFDSTADLYFGLRTDILAARIEKTVYRAFEKGVFEDSVRDLKFQYAVGNNTTEEEQWAASAQHAQAVAERGLEIDKSFRSGFLHVSDDETWDEEDEEEAFEFNTDSDSEMNWSEVSVAGS